MWFETQNEGNKVTGINASVAIVNPTESHFTRSSSSVSSNFRQTYRLELRNETTWRLDVLDSFSDLTDTLLVQR